MKMKHYFVLSLVVLCVNGCKSTSNALASAEERQRLTEFMDKASFEIISDWAMPLATNSLNSIANLGLLRPGDSPSQFSLIGNPNFVRVKGDSLEVYLPYFGERQMGGGYGGTDSAIQFDGVPKDPRVKKEDDGSYDLLFKVNNSTESFDVNIAVFPNLRSIIWVNSNQRFPITYTGRIKTIENDSLD